MPDLKRTAGEQLTVKKPSGFTGWPTEQVREAGPRKYSHPEPADLEAKNEALRELMQDEALGDYEALEPDVASDPANRVIYVPILGKYLTPAEFMAFKKLAAEEGSDQGYDPAQQFRMQTFEGAPEVFEEGALIPEKIDYESDPAGWKTFDSGNRGRQDERDVQEARDLGYRSRIMALLNSLGAGSKKEEAVIPPPEGMELDE